MNAEQSALKKPERRSSLEEVGTLPERTSVGNRPRGLQRNGDAWNYFTHDQARSRAYRWGEDGLAGISDDRQSRLLCIWRSGTAKIRS